MKKLISVILCLMMVSALIPTVASDAGEVAYRQGLELYNAQKYDEGNPSKR